MKRLVFTKPRSAEIEEVPIPPPSPGKALVRVNVSGISAGTELSYFRGAPQLRLAKEEYTYPILPGYEAVGVVEASGQGVTHIRPGDRVVCFGYHAEYVEVDAEYCARLPDTLSDESATLAVLSVTTMHAIRRAAIEYGDCVVVVGLGVVGILAGQQAKLAGASHVFGVDINPWRCSKAIEFGLDRAINPTYDQALQEILKTTDGIGADVVIEAAGVPPSFENSLLYARDRGRVVILGYHTLPVQFIPGEEFFYKELTILATRAAGPQSGLPVPYVRWTGDRNLELAVELLASGRIQVEGMITHRFPYHEAQNAYDLIDQSKENFLQILLNWHKEDGK